MKRPHRATLKPEKFFNISFSHQKPSQLMTKPAKSPMSAARFGVCPRNAMKSGGHVMSDVGHQSMTPGNAMK